MNCPTCKDKKGRPVQVHPVSRTCQKCGTRVEVSHSGKHEAIAKKKPAAPAPAAKP